MEDVLEVYRRPYDPARPLICMDESSHQLLDEVRTPIPMQPGSCRRVDDEYVRRGVAEIFMAVEPLGGRRHTKITERRTRQDWAGFIRELVDVEYREADRIVLVMDNLNVHGVASLYAAFPPQEALRIAEKLEIHYTPKHGSWLNIAEIELSVYKRQCLSGRRLPTIEKMREETQSWENSRNGRMGKVDWHFTTEEARTKLKRLYPLL